MNYDHLLTNISRIRFGFSDPARNSFLIGGIELVSSGLQVLYLAGDVQFPVAAATRVDNSFPLTFDHIIRYSFDFLTEQLFVYKLSSLSDFNLGELKFILPINPLKNSFPVTTSLSSGVPLFQFFNSGALSSIVAIKIE